jgi:hypothetical protein
VLVIVFFSFLQQNHMLAILQVCRDIPQAKSLMQNGERRKLGGKVLLEESNTSMILKDGLESREQFLHLTQMQN